MAWRTVVVLALLTLSTAATATDVVARHVARSGNCTGLVPCFTTLQAALADAGTGPLLVKVFPGVYAESIDLSMAGNPASLTVQAVDSAGLPAVTGVLISPPLGEAFRNSVDPLPFPLTLRGVSVTSVDTDAIDIEGMLGVLTLEDVTASGAPFDGIDIRTRNHVILTRVRALQNGNDGIQIRFEAAGDLTVTHSVANGNRGFGNGDDGFEIDMYDGSVAISDTTANDNGADGMDIDGAPGAVRIVAVTLTRVTASGNGIVGSTPGDHDGIDIANVRSDAIATRLPLGNVSIRATAARNNQGSGFDVERATGGSYLIADSAVTGNGSDGLQMTLDGVTASSIGPPGFAVQVRDLVASANGAAAGVSGFGMRVWDARACTLQPPMDVDLQRITLHDNEAGGGDVRVSRAVSGNVLLARGNGFGEGRNAEGDGLSFGAAPVTTETGQGPCAPTSVNLTSVFTEQNAGDGLEVNAAGAVALTAITASGNGNALAAIVQQDGIDVTHVRAPGGPIVLRDCRVNGNRDDGLDFGPLGAASVESCELRGNGVDGLDTVAQPGNVDGGVSIVDVDAIQNGDDGYDVDTPGSLSVRLSSADRNASDGLFVKRVLGTLSISASSFTGNGQAGIQLRQLGGGSHGVTASDFVGNAFGVANLTSNVGLSFGGNYWGSASGPTHPSNPAGRGDRVYDGATGGIGLIGFAGFVASSAVPVQEVLQVPALGNIGMLVLASLLVLAGAARRMPVAIRMTRKRRR